MLHARLFAVAALLFSAGCVLFVSEQEYGTHCRFSGENTGCGRCLRSRCQLDVDACCRDEGCSSTIGAIEACSAQTPGACHDLASRREKAGADGALATCAAKLCGPVCHDFTGVSDTTCKEPPFGRGATCECTSTPGAGNDLECSPTSYDSTVCCAPDSWPAAGSECTCLPVSCYGTPEGCSCRLVDTPPEKTQCEAPPCCVSLVDPDQCSCRATCYENERQTQSCSATGKDRVIGCPKGQKAQDSCSLRSQ